MFELFHHCRHMATAGSLALLVFVASPASAQPRPSTSERAASLIAESRALADHGQHREALAKLDAAFALANPRASTSLAGTIELRRSVSLRALGERAAAARVAGRARTLATRAGNQGLIVDSIVQLAHLQNEGGDVEGAVALLEDGRATAERIKDEAKLVVVLEALARLRHGQGRSLEAIDLASRTIPIADRIGNVHVSIMGRSTRANNFLALGRFDEALADADRAYELSRGGRPVLEAAATFTLAQVHAHIWNLERAEGLWNEAIAAYRRSGLKLGLGQSLRQRMDTRFALRSLDDAARDGEEALTVLESTGPYMLPGLLARLALIEARRERLDAARAYASRAAALKVPHGTSRFVHNDLGLVGLALSAPDTAEMHFRIVQDVARSIPDTEYIWRAEYGLGRTALLRGDAGLATTLLTQAVAGIERMRRTLPDAAMRAAFLSDRTNAHEALMEALAAQSVNPGDEFARRALSVAEMARGRSLADLLAEADRLPQEPALRAVRETETTQGRRLSETQRRVATAASEAERTGALADLHAAEREFESLVSRLRREQPAYASLRYPQPLSAEQIQNLLHDDEALVEFATGEHAGFGWLVRRSEIRLFRIPPRPALESAVRLVEAISSAADAEALRASGRRLGELLLGPARDHLQGVTRLVIVPDGPLHRLPFAAVRLHDDRWLIEHFALTVAPSATVLAELRARPLPSAARPVLAFAASAENPTAARLSPAVRTGGRSLQHADLEVRDTLRILGAADGHAARTETAVKAMRNDPVRVVHFAAHAVADEAVPRRSGVLLEQDEREDGWLQVHEIPHLSMSADLVVLATCRSHAGRFVRGEGLLGLSRAFMRAGGRAVVATLWDVDDAETRRFVRGFYRELRAGGRPDVALREAQLQMIRAGGRSADPRVWAPFIITGDASHVLFEAPPRTTKWLVTLAACLAITAAAAVLLRRRRAAISANIKTA